MSFYIFAGGVANTTEAAVRKAIEAYGAREKIKFKFLADPEPFSYLATGYCDLKQKNWIFVWRDVGKNVFLLFPATQYDFGALAAYLSAALRRPVITVFVDDGGPWGYSLFLEGELRDRFVNFFDHDGPLSEAERKASFGDKKVLAAAFGKRPEEIAKYLVDAGRSKQQGRKAYPDDAFAIGACKQLADFMRRLGFETLSSFWVI